MESEKFEKSEPEPERREKDKEKPSLVELKEQEASKKIIENFEKVLESKDQILMENPVFEAKGTTFKIKNEVDFLVASSQVECKLAERILKEVREKNDYWQEKTAAKLVELFEKRADFISRFAEIKLYYPEIAKSLEKHSPYLNQIYEEAKENWQRYEHHLNSKSS